MTSSFYMGPIKPRLMIRSWEDAVGAAAAGVLDETHWVELKEAVPPSSKPANLELARDLASLSVDGGLFIVGIKDSSGAAGEVVGTDLEGLETRVAQVATGRVAPPLPVTLDVFPKPGDPSLGLLVVTVPASQAAPHMVDEKYWGRGPTGKRPLSDGEVRRLMELRQVQAAGFNDRLRHLPSRIDPVDLDGQGRLYLLLEPAAPSSEAVSELVARKHMLELVIEGLGFRPQWSPSFESLNWPVPHPDGRAAASLSPNTATGTGFEYLFILLEDVGAVQVSAPVVRPWGPEPDAPMVISPGHLLELVHGTLRLTSHLASAYTGYGGSWRAGILGTKLRGLRPSQAYASHELESYPPFATDQYVELTETSTREMTDETSAVVGRLVKRLLRGFSVENRFLPYNDPSEFYPRSH